MLPDDGLQQGLIEGLVVDRHDAGFQYRRVLENVTWVYKINSNSLSYLFPIFIFFEKMKKTHSPIVSIPHLLIIDKSLLQNRPLI